MSFSIIRIVYPPHIFCFCFCPEINPFFPVNICYSIRYWIFIFFNIQHSGIFYTSIISYNSGFNIIVINYAFTCLTDNYTLYMNWLISYIFIVGSAWRAIHANILHTIIIIRRCRCFFINNKAICYRHFRVQHFSIISLNCLFYFNSNNIRIALWFYLQNKIHSASLFARCIP